MGGCDEVCLECLEDNVYPSFENVTNVELCIGKLISGTYNNKKYSKN